MSDSPRPPAPPDGRRQCSNRRLVGRVLGMVVALATAAPGLRAQQASPPTACAPSGRRTAARVGVGTVFVAGNAALYEYFRRAWWSGERAPQGFWVHYDWDLEFRDQDKLGHFLGGYHLARVSDRMLRFACVSPVKATLWGAAYATAFQLQIEIWDGYQKDYGFSPPDLLANATGAALYVVQARYARARIVRPTISYARTAALKRAPAGAELRPTVDYSGQTYWLSFDVDPLLPRAARRWWPDVLRLSAGHSITDWVDPETQLSERARRKFVLSVDLDLSKLPGRNPIWRSVKEQLAYYHFPAPALQLTPSLRAVSWYR